ncbi:zf-HC2 domain-containing protein [Paenibacillus tritici]|uniref:Anti-sigma-W factor RsiW n=1 Tax=Paenibacillus tritici TaxID=1873425 RepID=A0ABX2DRX4_9BACL|nr:zf-HC2 domain-containing protein [Paenibacillus tritici]NQX46922.1 zf-HC2 domain-containing protein [Paenibacillus tritici]QUL55221.1 zf-HC2 domain-containing protein [Paenibacillus tritici]
MTRIPCDVIQDLLPLYYDEICSESTKQLVEEHLAVCADCRSALEQMQSSLNLTLQEKELNTLEGSGLQNIKKWWSRTRWIAFIRGMIVAASLCGILIIGYWVLFRWNIQPVSSDQIKIFDIRARSNGEIAFQIQIRGGYAQVKNTLKDDGSYYITPVHPLIVSKRDKTNTPVISGMYVNPLNLRAYYKNHGKDTEITSIYYGSPDQPILIWKKGMALPAGD